MWSKLAPLKSISGHLKIGQSIMTAVTVASSKQAEKKHDVVSPKTADRNIKKKAIKESERVNRI